MKIVKYIILYNIMWGISITMCYFHRFIDDINYSLQDFLITITVFITIEQPKLIRNIRV